jgi:hypothetical protein
MILGPLSEGSTWFGSLAWGNLDEQAPFRRAMGRAPNVSGYWGEARLYLSVERAACRIDRQGPNPFTGGAKVAAAVTTGSPAPVRNPLDVRGPGCIWLTGPQHVVVCNNDVDRSRSCTTHRPEPGDHPTLDSRGEAPCSQGRNAACARGGRPGCRPSWIVVDATTAGTLAGSFLGRSDAGLGVDRSPTPH